MTKVTTRSNIRIFESAYGAMVPKKAPPVHLNNSILCHQRFCAARRAVCTSSSGITDHPKKLAAALDPALTASKHPAECVSGISTVAIAFSWLLCALGAAERSQMIASNK